MLPHALRYPGALYGVNHRHPHLRHAPGHSRVHPGKVILDKAVFPKPGGLVADAGRIIPLGGALHADPGKMGNAQGYPQRRLPVSLKFVPPEVKIPSGDAVQLAHHSLTAILTGNRLCLLRGGKLSFVAEKVDARNRKFPVLPHGLPHRAHLRKEAVLLQHMPGEGDPVFRAPSPDPVAVGPGEQLRGMGVKVIPRGGGLIPLFVPHQFRHTLYHIISEALTERFPEGLRPGKFCHLPVPGKFLHPDLAVIRLVRKDYGNPFAEFAAQLPLVGPVGDVDESVHRLRVHGIQVGKAVMPARQGLQHGIEIPPLPLRRLPGLRHPVILQPVLPVKAHVIDGQKPWQTGPPSPPAPPGKGRPSSDGTFFLRSHTHPPRRWASGPRRTGREASPLPFRAPRRP